MSAKPSMVFHLPYEIDDNPTGAGGIRPHRMRKAFADLGYEVFDMSGNKPQRSKKTKELKKRLRSGWRPDFMYAENSTMPNLFASSIKEGINPLLEYSIMRCLRKADVPLGMFYRDAYWKYAGSRPKGVYGAATVPLNMRDMVGYRKNKLHLFLPSLPMAEILSLSSPLTWSELPPAGDPGKALPLPEAPLRFFYVGGFKGHYQLDEFISALGEVGNGEMNLVTRKPEWDETVAEKPQLKIPQLNVMHLSSYELEPIYAESQVCVLAVKPSDYRQFAVPFKLYEYLSYGRPIIATQHTQTGRIVADLDAGWVVPYGHDEFVRLVKHLRDNPQEVAEKAANARKSAAENTWLDRARAVVETLTA